MAFSPNALTDLLSQEARRGRSGRWHIYGHFLPDRANHLFKVNEQDNVAMRDFLDASYREAMRKAEEVSKELLQKAEATIKVTLPNKNVPDKSDTPATPDTPSAS
jgi:hypothetical protein